MANMKRWVVAEPYLELDCALGEAPYYEADSHQLRFLDIIKQKLHVIDLNKGPSSLKSLDLEVTASVTADIEGRDEEIIVGAKHGFAILDRRSGKHTYINHVWDHRDGSGKEKRMRFNDGAVDSQGRFWAGTMDEPLVTKPTNEGVLFRLDPDMTLHRILEHVTIPNGMAWSSDDTTMFFTDSPEKKIFKYDYDAATGHISNRRVFFQYEGEDGAIPDGLAIDCEDNIWTAIFGSSKILRLSPTGEIVGEISLPTRCITCPAFAGEDLFVTSAMEEEPEKYPDSTKYAGSLFKVSVGIQGGRVNKFRGRLS